MGRAGFFPQSDLLHQPLNPRIAEAGPALHAQPRRISTSLTGAVRNHLLKVLQALTGGRMGEPTIAQAAGTTQGL
ncbi:MAG: hypothetical protein WAL64_11480 [Candidatus Dormiibacterota bacterium]